MVYSTHVCRYIRATQISSFIPLIDVNISNMYIRDIYLGDIFFYFYKETRIICGRVRVR